VANKHSLNARTTGGSNISAVTAPLPTPEVRCRNGSGVARPAEFPAEPDTS
jgi:hypothetical protein